MPTYVIAKILSIARDIKNIREMHALCDIV